MAVLVHDLSVVAGLMLIVVEVVVLAAVVAVGAMFAVSVR